MCACGVGAPIMLGVRNVRVELREGVLVVIWGDRTTAYMQNNIKNDLVCTEI